MPTDTGSLLLLGVLVFLSAVLYSSVGHGGASAYLAVMALFGILPLVMKPAALVMNLGVAGAGTIRFASARLVPWRLLLPLCAGSVPAAYAGGLIELPTRSHRVLLGAVLLVAAVRLAMRLRPDALRPPPPALGLAAIGVVFGFVAGLTGVGGGIFLSPLLILARWEETRMTAGASAFFILVNSAAGLAGHLAGGGSVPLEALPLTAVALAGGLLGSWLGARRLVPVTLRRILAAVLLVAGTKLLVSG
ncbi:MAG TPA: sulfite exporter TauE/SafE family protein [Thermoanaerobaculia bacterium]|nr:sulfite exporter TauE/SafE family protein [Thermoanaerobaculia bacterium]